MGPFYVGTWRQRRWQPILQGNETSLNRGNGKERQKKVQKFQSRFLAKPRELEAIRVQFQITRYHHGPPPWSRLRRRDETPRRPLIITTHQPGKNSVVDRRQAIRRGRKTNSRFPAKPGEIQQFWGQMGIILANLKGELQGALSSSTCPTRQTLELTSTNFWSWKLFNMGMTDFCDQPKNFFNVSSANHTQQAQSLDVKEWSTAKNKLVPQGQWNRPH